jgi:hypothetical protein
MNDQEPPALGKARRSMVVRFALGVIVALTIQVPLTFFVEKVLELKNPDALNSITTFQDEVWNSAQSLSPVPVLIVFGNQYSKAEPGCLKQGLYGMVCTIVSATILTPAKLTRDANTVGAWFMVIGMICVIGGAVYATIRFTSKAAPYWYAYFSVFCLLGLGSFTCFCFLIQLVMLAGWAVLGSVIYLAGLCSLSSFMCSGVFCLIIHFEHLTSEHLVHKLRGLLFSRLK